MWSFVSASLLSNTSSVSAKMNSQTVSKSFAATVLLVFLYALPAKSDFDLEKCRGVDIDKSESTAMNVKECLEAAGGTKLADVTAEKLPCFGKCVMQKQGIIDDKGLPHKENIMKMITEGLPKVVHDDLIKAISICLDEETSMIDPTDESCQTYMPMGMCMHLAFLEECEK